MSLYTNLRLEEGQQSSGPLSSRVLFFDWGWPEGSLQPDLVSGARKGMTWRGDVPHSQFQNELQREFAQLTTEGDDQAIQAWFWPELRTGANQVRRHGEGKPVRGFGQ